jgi:hypothetical protein
MRGPAGTALLLGLVAFLAWPFLDRADPATARGRLAVRGFRAAGGLLAALALATMLGVLG